MILKSGTYRFNDVISGNGVPFDVEDPDYDYQAIYPFVSNSITYGMMWMSGNIDNSDFISIVYMTENYDYAMAYSYEAGEGDGVTLIKGWQSEALQTQTLTADTEVDDTYGAWYIANTNYNEVNASSLVTIEYNGSTIAELNAGDKATLSCAGMKMASELVIKINV